MLSINTMSPFSSLLYTFFFHYKTLVDRGFIAWSPTHICRFPMKCPTPGDKGQIDLMIIEDTTWIARIG